MTLWYYKKVIYIKRQILLSTIFCVRSYKRNVTKYANVLCSVVVLILFECACIDYQRVLFRNDLLLIQWDIFRRKKHIELISVHRSEMYRRRWVSVTNILPLMLYILKPDYMYQDKGNSPLTVKHWIMCTCNMFLRSACSRFDDMTTNFETIEKQTVYYI